MQLKIIKDLFPSTLQELKEQSTRRDGFTFTDTSKYKNLYIANAQQNIIVMPDGVAEQLEAVCPKEYLSFALNSIIGFSFIYAAIARDDVSTLVVDSAMKSLGLRYEDFPDALDTLASAYLEITAAIDIDGEWRNSAQAYLKAREEFKKSAGVNPSDKVLDVWDATLKNECYDYVRTATWHVPGKLQRLSISYRPSQVTFITANVATVVTAASYVFAIGTSHYCALPSFNALASDLSRGLSDDEAISATVQHISWQCAKPMSGPLATRLGAISATANPLFGLITKNLIFNKDYTTDATYVARIAHFVDSNFINVNAIWYDLDDEPVSKGTPGAVERYYTIYRMTRISDNVDVFINKNVVPSVILLSCINALIVESCYCLRDIYTRSLQRKLIKNHARDLVRMAQLQKQLFSIQYRRLVLPQFRCVSESDYDNVIEMLQCGDVSEIFGDIKSNILELALVRHDWEDAELSYRTAVYDVNGVFSPLDIYYGSEHNATDEVISLSESIFKLAASAGKAISSL